MGFPTLTPGDQRDLIGRRAFPAIQHVQALHAAFRLARQARATGKQREDSKGIRTKHDDFPL